MKHKEDDRLKPWKEKIAIMFLVQEEVQRQDKNRIYQYFYPEGRIAGYNVGFRFIVNKIRIFYGIIYKY